MSIPRLIRKRLSWHILLSNGSRFHSILSWLRITSPCLSERLPTIDESINGVVLDTIGCTVGMSLIIGDLWACSLS